MKKSHIFFTIEDHMGVHLHNHIAHHDLTLWAFGTKPDLLRSLHERNYAMGDGSISIIAFLPPSSKSEAAVYLTQAH